MYGVEIGQALGLCLLIGLLLQDDPGVGLSRPAQQIDVLGALLCHLLAHPPALGQPASDKGCQEGHAIYPLLTHAAPP